MAIQWSAWAVGNDGNAMRVGIDVSWSTVTNSSSSATATFRTYTENRYAYNDNQTLTFSGGMGSGSINYHNSSGNTGNRPVLRSTRTWTYTYPASSYGTSPGGGSFRAAVSGTYNNGNPAKTVQTTIPARPYAAPADVSGFSASRIDDYRASLTWTNNATTGRPYDSITLYQSHWDGSDWVPAYQIATLSGSATSFTRTGMGPNNIYYWWLQPRNSAGSAPNRVGIGVGLNTTPAAPTSVTAQVTGQGASVLVSWTNNVYGSSTPPKARSYIIERSVNGGAWSQVAAGVTGSSWTDNSPGAGAAQYRVAAKSDYSLPLVSAWTESNVVSTIVPPLAPTNLDPDGETVDFTETVRLSWRHNHGGDGVPQSAFDLQVSDDGGATWADVVTNSMSTDQYFDLPANTLTNGVQYQWRVRTVGVTSEGPGPWSNAATIFGSDRPVVTITAPGPTTDTGTITVTWDYVQPESFQSQWEAVLLDENGTVLSEASGYGPTTEHAFNYRVEDQTTYTIRVRGRSEDGLWSAWDETTTLVDFPDPAEVDVVVDWDHCEGTIALSITSTVPGPDEDPTIAVVVERKVGDGEWVTLAEELPIPNTLLDPLPTTAGANHYRITSISAIPTYRVNDIITVWTPSGHVGPTEPSGLGDPTGQWIHLSYGTGWQTTLRLNGDPEITDESGRVVSVEPLLGRSRPVALFGANTTLVYNVKASAYVAPFTDCQVPEDDCTYSSGHDTWQRLAQEAGLVAYRDYLGHRVFGVVDGVSVSHVYKNNLIDVAFTVTQTDYTEVYGTPILPGGGPVVVDDFHITLESPEGFRVWGLSVNNNSDSGEGWTAQSDQIINYSDGSWSATETE